MSDGGVFIYQCVANNTVGTGQSESVTVTVNGEQDNCVMQIVVKVRFSFKVLCLYKAFWFAKLTKEAIPSGTQ